MCHQLKTDWFRSIALQSSSAKEAARFVFANTLKQLLPETSCRRFARISCGLICLLRVLLQLAWTQTTICSLIWPGLSNPQAGLKHRRRAIAIQYLSKSSRRYLPVPCAPPATRGRFCLLHSTLVCARTVRHVCYRNRSKLKEKDDNIEFSATRVVAQMQQSQHQLVR